MDIAALVLLICVGLFAMFYYTIPNGRSYIWRNTTERLNIRRVKQKYAKEYHLWLAGDIIKLEYFDGDDIYEGALTLIANSKDNFLGTYEKNGNEYLMYVNKENVPDLPDTNHYIYLLNNISLNKRRKKIVTDDLKQSFNAYQKVKSEL